MIDPKTFPFTEITKNSILVLRLPATSQDDIQAVEKLAQELRPKIDPSVAFLIMRADTEVYMWPESVLNAAGWYKK